MKIRGETTTQTRACGDTFRSLILCTILLYQNREFEMRLMSVKSMTWVWRKGWDSNPRYPCGHAGFQDRCLKPLGHPSNCSRIKQLEGKASRTGCEQERSWGQLGANLLFNRR